MKSQTLPLALGMLALILACNMPFSRPDDLPDTPIKTPVSTATNTPLPSQEDLDDVLTFGGAATNTPLPPMPEFEKMLTFGGGGGEPRCDDFGAPNTITAPNVAFGASSYFCMMILGMNFNKPFHLLLIAPDGRIYSSPNLRLNQNTKAVQWESYQGFDGDAEWSGNGILYAGLSVWWPSNLSEGEWQVHASGDSFLATGRFLASKRPGRSYITATDARAETQIVPSSPSGVFLHPLRPKASGTVDVVGSDFPANTVIYVLLYRYIATTPETAELVEKLAVTSDSAGSIKAELSGPFVAGQSYLLIGLSDPSTPLSGGVLNSDPDFPSDFFRVEGDAASVGVTQVSSCPGAPPQRMIVNQRGHVCTQSDSVHLRSAPARSASTLIQLKPDTLFTVIGGPSCSDDWSWWNIQLSDGTTGWVSEGGDEVDQYFICPN